MNRGDLFSPLECFISDAAKLIRREESGYSVSEIISKNGCIIHSFINEFVNIIIITEAEYYQFTKDLIDTASLIFVTPNWVFDSYESATILPYQSYNPNPNAIFSECYFYIISNSKDSILSLSEAITYFGGSIVFDKSMYITHFVIAQEVQTTHPIKGTTSTGIKVLSEATLWEYICNKIKLRRSFPPSNNLLPGKEPDTLPVQQTDLFCNTCFLVLVDHPYERSLLTHLLHSHAGEVHCLTHALDATALFSLQQTTQQVILLTYTTSPLTRRLCQLHPEMTVRTPYWIYDILERTMTERYLLLYLPHGAMDLFGQCFVLFGSQDLSYYKRLIESCNGLVTRPLPCSIVLTESMGYVPKEMVEQGLSVYKIQWIEDSVRAGCILPFSRYSFESHV